MRFRFIGLLLVILIIIDQSIKGLVSTYVPLGTAFSIIPNIISLANIHNNGAAWSMLENQQWFFVLLALIVSTVLCYYLYKLHSSKLKTITLVLLLAGTLGNVIDRLVHGYVVDMFQLDFVQFPIFNFADMCLTFGVLCLFWVILKED